jgi:hypothetical protein
MNLDLQNLVIGQRVGILHTTMGSPHTNRYIPVTINRLTKTTIIVITRGGDARKFNRNNGYEYGSSGSWNRDVLIGEELLDKGLATNRIKRAISDRAFYREQMINKMLDARHNDAAFRILLAELNSREYVA